MTLMFDTRPPVMSRATSREASVMDRVNPRVRGDQRLRDFRRPDGRDRWRGPTRERACGAARALIRSSLLAKPLRKLAIETKTPPDLSGGVLR